jgi:hypothetical protein
VSATRWRQPGGRRPAMCLGDLAQVTDVVDERTVRARVGEFLIL